MKDEFLTNYLITYIAKRIAKKFDTNSIIDEVYDMKKIIGMPQISTVIYLIIMI